MSDRTRLLIIIMASSILSLIATDIILPSLPHMADYFSITAEDAKMLISFFMIGQFLTVLLWGIIADIIGKKQTLLLGMVLFFIGSILALDAHSIITLYISRFLQGAGAVVVPVAGWALINDMYSKDESAKAMSWIGTIISTIPLFAPALGGKIDNLFGWYANLYVIAIYAAGILLAFLLSPKFTKQKSFNLLELKKTFNIYKQVISNKIFFGYIALFGFLNCGEWCFLTVAPFYYKSIGFPPEIVGLYLTYCAIGFVLGTFISTFLINHVGVNRTLSLGLKFALISSLLFLLAIFFKIENQLVYVIFLATYLLSAAILWGSTTSRALQCYPDNKGAASAIRSLYLILFAAFGSLIGRLIHHSTLLPVGLFLFALISLAFLVFISLNLCDEESEVEEIQGV